MTINTDPHIPFTRRRPRGRRADYTICRHSKTVCPTIGLVRYRNRDQARQALNGTRWQRNFELMAFGASSRNETRIFRCQESECNGGYHLTSIYEWRGENPARVHAASIEAKGWTQR